MWREKGLSPHPSCSFLAQRGASTGPPGAWEATSMTEKKPALLGDSALPRAISNSVKRPPSGFHWTVGLHSL